MKYVCNLYVINKHDLCTTLLTNKIMFMEKEKALKIQRYYDYFRFAVVVSTIGLLLFLAS